MPHPAPSRPSARVVGCLAVLVLTLAGCGGGQSSGSSAEPSSSSTSPSPSASSSQSPEPSDQPSSTGSPTVAPGGSTLRSRLLTAAELPGFNEDYRWAQGPTAPEDPSTSFGTCQKFAVTSIGAEQALVRRFRPTGGGPSERAGELVASFPDAPTARRAFGVLQAWRGQCADRLRRWKRSDVGAPEAVRVSSGRGQWYLLTYGPVPGDPDYEFFDAQGMVLVGTRIAMLSMVGAGQDFNYERGQEPMVAAVQRAAQKLG